MDELKFRAWFKPDEPTHNGNFMLYSGVVNKIEYPRIYGVKEFQQFWDNVRSYRANVFVMRYTGMKDKKGKEIFEGDIIQTDTGYYDEDFIAQIRFKDSCWVIQYPIQKNDKTYYQDFEILGEGYDIEPQDVIVIGNIYENKDLMEGLKCHQ